MFTGVLGQASPETLQSFFKGTGILGAIGILLFVIIRYKVIRIVAVDQATELIRTKWHVAQYYRFGVRKGRLVRLKQGRHLIVRGIHDGWEVSLKEVAMELENVTQPYRGRMLTFDRITIGYEVIAPDTVKGDEVMLRSILSVRDNDRENGTSQNLDQKVRGITLQALGQVLTASEPDKYGLPRLSDRAVLAATAKRLKKHHGVRLVSFEVAAPTWAQGQQQYDAAMLIATAMGLNVRDSSETATDDNVIGLPSQSKLA